MEKTTQTTKVKEKKVKTQAVYEVEANKFIAELASQLANIEQFKQPEWSALIKTGAGKERPPEAKNWWYVRAASTLRKLYIKPYGTERLRRQYRTKKDRGAKPERVYKTSGKIIRTVLQQAEKAELVEKREDKKGRQLTRKGRTMLDEIAKNLKEKSE